MKKYLVAAVACLGFVSASSFAGLTLVSKNATANIAVWCNGTKGMFDIPKNGSLGPLPWSLIEGMFGNVSKMDCQFKLDDNSNKQIGSAHLVLTASTGTITNVKHDPNYTVTSNHDWGTTNASTTVTLTKN